MSAINIVKGGASFVALVAEFKLIENMVIDKLENKKPDGTKQTTWVSKYFAPAVAGASVLATFFLLNKYLPSLMSKLVTEEQIEALMKDSQNQSNVLYKTLDKAGYATIQVKSPGSQALLISH